MKKIISFFIALIFFNSYSQEKFNMHLDTLKKNYRVESYTLNSFSLYQDLAWGSLTGTNAFNKLDEASKTRIKGTVAAERYNNNVNTNGQTQKGKKLGC